MAESLVNGATFAIAASYGPVKQMTAVTNANPPVATLEATHGIIVGDVFEITSGWSRLTNKVARASLVAVNDVTVEGVNTVSTLTFPPGGGIGSVREVLTWIQLSQVLSTSSSGGSQNFLTFQYVESDSESQIPTNKTASVLTLKVADDPALLGYQLASTANDDRQPRAVRISLPSGAKIYFMAYISIGKVPSMDINQLMAVEMTFSMRGEIIRYAT